MITAEDIVMYKNIAMVHVDANTTVFDALKLMVERKIGAVVVKKDDKIVGLWTERDLMLNCIQDGFDLKTSKIGEVMPPAINSVPHDTPLNTLQERFLGQYLRHVFVEKEGKIIGLISCGDAMEAGLHYKTHELEKINSFVSIDYYENWRRPPKKK